MSPLCMFYNHTEILTTLQRFDINYFLTEGESFFSVKRTKKVINDQPANKFKNHIRCNSTKKGIDIKQCVDYQRVSIKQVFKYNNFRQAY